MIRHIRRLTPLTLLLPATMLSAQEIQSAKDTTKVEEEVQVIAYGRLPKREITSAVSTLTGSDIEKNTVFSLGNTLYGKVPGLIVDQNSGEPGNDLPGFSMRGVPTFGFARAPLVLVDGFIRDLNSVSVFDVDQITVLKECPVNPSDAADE